MTADDATLSDPRWIRFNEQGLACTCGETHKGMFPVHILCPVGWPGSTDYEPDENLRMDGDFLSANYCVWQGKYFAIRMRLPLRISGAPPWAFVFTAWASVNQPDFEAYVDAFRNNKLNSQARAQARLVNRLNGFPDTVNLMGIAFQQEDGGAPLLLIPPAQEGALANHPIIAEQRDGISLDRVFDLFAGYGHDMRPALS